MPIRERAMYKGQIVTVLEGKIGGRSRGKTKIRTASGFVQEVAARELTKIRPDERIANFKFGEGV